MASRCAKKTFLTNYEPHILDVRERFKGQFSLYTHIAIFLRVITIHFGVEKPVLNNGYVT